MTCFQKADVLRVKILGNEYWRKWLSQSVRSITVLVDTSVCCFLVLYVLTLRVQLYYFRPKRLFLEKLDLCPCKSLKSPWIFGLKFTMNRVNEPSLSNFLTLPGNKHTNKPIRSHVTLWQRWWWSERAWTWMLQLEAVSSCFIQLLVWTAKLTFVHVKPTLKFRVDWH